MSSFDKELIKKEIREMTYKKDNRNWINFHGTYGDYQVPMEIHKITPKGHLKLTEYNGWTGSQPSNPRNRLAKLNERNGEPYWWISDGTGSLVLKRRYFKPIL